MPIDVFISYATADRPTVEQIAQELERRGMSVAFDRSYLVPGRSWPESLENVLFDCRAVAAIVGSGGLGRWQRREIHLALDRQAGDNDFLVVPVLLSGADPPLGFLSLNTWLDLQGGFDRVVDDLAAALEGRRRDDDQDGMVRRTVSPYRGLRPFREEDAVFFHGRTAFTERLVATVRHRPFVAVVGPSGSGKSSVVKAGLVPHLRRAGSDGVWEIVEMVPGTRPFRSLAAVLAPLLEPRMTEVDLLMEIGKLAGYLEDDPMGVAAVIHRALERQPGTDRLLLIVDQWEELYSTDVTDDVSSDFKDALLDASANSPLSVVLTVRGDFYGRALEHRLMADTLHDAIVNISTMTRDELRAAIIEPARQVGLGFEPGLVDRILDDVGNEPGNLPLLEFVLDELWLAGDGGLFTHDAYGRLGGVQGALAVKADETVDRLGPAHVEDVRHIFLHLVQPGTETGDTRRRATAAEIGPASVPIVRQLADARLLVTARDRATNEQTVEVAHEALLRNWSRLQSWVEADREFLAWRQRLEAGVAAWVHADRDDGGLLRGAQLSEAERWVGERSGDLSKVDCSFIQQSMEQRELRERLEIERARRSSRQAWRLVAALSAVVVTAVVALLVALDLRGQARAQARLAFVAQLSESARADLDEFPNRGALLAVEAARQSGERRIPTVDAALRAAVAVPRGRPLPGQNGTVRAVDVGAGGRWIATGDDDGAVRLWDTDNLSADPIVFDGHTDRIRTLSLSSDGNWLASGDRDGRILLHRPSSPAESIRLNLHPGWVNTLEIDPTGTWLGSGGEQGVLGIWSLRSGSPESQGDQLRLDTAIKSLAFSMDGRRLAVGTSFGTIVLRDLDPSATPAVGPPIELAAHGTRVTDLQFSDDGQWLLSASWDGTAKLWNLRAGQAQLADELPHSDEVNSAVLLPGSPLRVLTGSRDGVVRLWSVEPDGSSDFIVLTNHRDPVTSVGLVPDSDRVVSVGLDGTVRLGDVEDRSAPVIQWRGHEGGIESLAISDDGRWLITGGRDSNARLWSVNGDDPTIDPQANQQDSTTASIAVGNGGAIMAAANSDGEIRLWDSEAEVPMIPSGGFPITDLALSPSGRWLVKASNDIAVDLVDLHDSDHRQRRLAEEDFVLSVAFSDDDRLVATGNARGSAKVWTTDTSSPAVDLRHNGNDVLAVDFSPNGRWLATGSRDPNGFARLWDLESPEPGDSGRELTGHTHFVSRVAFSDVGASLATGDETGLIRIWDHTDLDRDPIDLAVDGAVTDLAFSADGRQLVASTDAGITTVWDLTTTDLASSSIELEHHDGRVNDVAFSDDGRWIATAGDDDRARLFLIDEATGGQPLPTAELIQDSDVRTVAFLSDGRLATLSENDSVRIWHTEAEELIALACASAGRNLTIEEWARFLPDDGYRKTCEQWPSASD